MSSRINRPFVRRTASHMTSRVPWATAVIAAIAILAPASNAQTAATPASTKTAAPSHRHAAAADPTPSAPVKTIGNHNAPITMEVFSDYQCPSCGNFYETTLRAMIQDYVASGKVYLVHHDFPLQMHNYSGQAARWANAAAMIGQFQDVDAALFDNQAKWTADGDLEKYVAGALSPANFKRVEAILKGCTGPAPTSKVDRSLPQAEAGCAGGSVHHPGHCARHRGSGAGHSHLCDSLQRPELSCVVWNYYVADSEAIFRYALEPVAESIRR